ncbi:MAG: DEAD/DEAH box helicase [Acidobacteriia bacterium]|nr:DEAD/DEAH box helicase [Terriglobia bacterium]
MNSKTTGRGQGHGGHRRGSRGGPRRGSRRSGDGSPHVRRSETRPPLSLEPIACDTTPVPFASLGLDPRLLEGTRDLGWTDTRPIQTAVIPLALAGQDLIACAETGTGKTAAFVVPTLQRLIAGDGSRSTGDGSRAETASETRPLPPDSRPPNKSRVLVLAPTRELAVQIEDEIHGLAYHTSVTSAAVYGGVEMGMQERALKAGVDIIVATPGRLMDHMRQQNADLSAVELLVLDEADRMMDMGFWPDVRRIITALPPVRQTLLFSATMPDEVVHDALEITRAAKYIQVGQRSAPPKSITHRVEAVAASRKVEWLIDHLRRPEGPVLIFSRTKIGADRLARRLAAAGVKCTALHADRSQDQRRIAVEGFKSGKYKVLVATDIAARGLDIDAIHTVINYEVPDSPDAYVHRVGRTGRADQVGQAITLVAPEERRALAFLAKSVGVPLE